MKKFKSESKRLLDLMVNSIYTNREIFLRELISNASDALDKLHYISLTDSAVNTDFRITVAADEKARTLTISDNGVGMTEKELDDNLGTIASSGTFKFKKDIGENEQNTLIGQFGVGFYSAFMVADLVTVISKAHGKEEAFEWKSSGAEGYEIKKCDKLTCGTVVILHLKSDDEDCEYSRFLRPYELERLIKKYSDYIRYPIVTSNESGEVKTLNSMVPLWKKPKNEVTEEERAEFYKHKFHDFNAPLKTMYFKIEGNIDYTAMLFVPQEPPFDYYTKEYERGLKLYSAGVLIMDNCKELLPEYLGFIKGVVDCADLSLNISREMLQHDRQLKAIAVSLEKKIISDLEKTLKDDRNLYEKIFDAFGQSIKFGAYGDFGAKKDMLKDILIFKSSKAQGYTTLAEYVSRMNEGQDAIYYITGESVAKIESLPQIEKFTEKNIDVLCLTDTVDEFVFKVLNGYDGKTFKNASSDAADIESEQEKELIKKTDAENKAMFKYIGSKLKGKVDKVRASMRLKSYPACLTSEGEVSLEMERVLNSIGGPSAVKAVKVLELNPSHEMFKKLAALYKTDKKLLADYALVLYYQALIFEGGRIAEAKEFIDALNSVILTPVSLKEESQKGGGDE